MVVKEWTSDYQSIELVGDVYSLFSMILSRLENSFGSVLTRTALGLITFSVNGINDLEMIDLLSINQDVVNAVNQFNQIDRVPHHVWL